MNVVFDIIHPADVHLFRLAVIKLLDRGDSVLVPSRDKEVTVELLDDAGIPHQVISRKPRGMTAMALELLQRNLNLWRAARRFGADLFVSSNSASASHVAWLMGKPSLVFDDTEINRLMRRLYRPFATEIHTPRCYRLDLGPKQRRYPGYHSLAYLRPGQFTPDPTVLAREELAAQARVLISSETAVPPDLAPHAMRSSPADIHHLIRFACLMIGESATMASEAAALGTPSILIDEQGRGYTDEQESVYGLCTWVKPGQWERVIEHALRILADLDPRKSVAGSHARLLADTVDLSGYQMAQIDRLARGGRTPGIRRRIPRSSRTGLRGSGGSP